MSVSSVGTTEITTCSSDILSVINNADNFSAWTSTKQTTLNSITTSSNPTIANQASLNSASNEIFNMIGCLQEKISRGSNTTNEIQSAQSSIINLNKEILEAETDVDIAKDRVAYLRNPEDRSSYYESWFPMGRPMHNLSVPFFIAINSFLVIFIILILFTFMGMNISFISLQGNYRVNNTLFTFPRMALAFLVGFIIYYFLVPK
jgi:hypothetical protein